MTVDARTRASSRCYRLDRLVRADEPATVCAAVSGRLLGVVATLEPDARLTLTMSARRLGAVTILLHAFGVGPGAGDDLAWCGRGSTCGLKEPAPSRRSLAPLASTRPSRRPRSASAGPCVPTPRPAQSPARPPTRAPPAAWPRWTRPRRRCAACGPLTCPVGHDAAGRSARHRRGPAPPPRARRPGGGPDAGGRRLPRRGLVGRRGARAHRHPRADAGPGRHARGSAPALAPTARSRQSPKVSPFLYPTRHRKTKFGFRLVTGWRSCR